MSWLTRLTSSFIPTPSASGEIDAGKSRTNSDTALPVVEAQADAALAPHLGSAPHALLGGEGLARAASNVPLALRDPSDAHLPTTVLLAAERPVGNLSKQVKCLLVWANLIWHQHLKAVAGALLLQ